ncbi:hypothetical protein EUGRSUZ_J01448, partial [Eucalyptus grandis]
KLLGFRRRRHRRRRRIPEGSPVESVLLPWPLYRVPYASLNTDLAICFGHVCDCESDIKVVRIDSRILFVSRDLSRKLNELMESKGGKKKSSSSKSLFYEAPLGYSIEDLRPHGGIKKFRSAAYSNVCRNDP